MRRASAPLLLLASVLVHWPTAPAELTYDDRDFVERNQAIRSLPAALAAFALPFPPDQPERALYRPLTNLSYALDHAVWGEVGFGFHLTNVLVYLAVVLLAQRLALAYLGSPGFALAVALLFSLHPVHCDAVDSVAGRSELLALAFALASLLYFLRALRAPAPGASAASAAFYALACLSKETAALLPAILAVHLLVHLVGDGPFDSSIRHPRERIRSLARNVPALAALALAPHLAVLGMYLALRVLSLGRFSPEAAILAGADLGTRLLTMGSVFFLDLRLLAWPATLEVDFYYQALVGLPRAPTLEALAGWLAALALLAAAGRIAWLHFSPGAPAGRAPERATALCAFAIFFATLFPTSHVLDIGALFAERFLFAPSLGFVLLLALAGRRLLERLPSPRPRRAAALALVALLSLAGAARSHQRAREWRAPVQLWQATARALPDDERVLVNLAEAHLRRGEAAQARAALARALALEPDYRPALGNLGVLALEAGRLDEAAATFRRLVELEPADFVSWYNLGVVEERRGQPARAIPHFQRSLAQNPNFALARSALERAEAAGGGAQESR
jgi:Tfp pilus assembly protein PilF